jgi:hypothetical protein
LLEVGYAPIATKFCSAAKCRDVPNSEVTALFDHLVGAGEQRRWHFEAKCLGGLKIDDKLVIGRRLHRQVGGLLALRMRSTWLAARLELWNFP